METSIDVEAARGRVAAVRQMLVRICAMLVALLQILFGTVLTMQAASMAVEWSALGLALRATATIWLIAGPVLLIGGTWLLVSLGRRRMFLWIGATAMFPAGAAMIVGVVTHFIPCATPT